MSRKFGVSLRRVVLILIIPLMGCFLEVCAQNRLDSLWTFSEIRSDTNGDNKLDHLGKEVSITGIANISSGLLHEHYLQAFIQNDSAGMSIFAMEIETPFVPGDSIVATGIIERYNGLAEVHIDSYRVYESASTLKKHSLSEAIEAPEQHLGMLVKGEGKVIEKGSTFNGKFIRISIGGSSKSMMVYVSNFHRLYDEFNFELPRMGDEVSVVGIITEYNPEFPDERTFKLFLRTPEDLDIKGIPQFYLYMIAGASMLLMAWVVGWIVVLRKTVKKKTKEIQSSLDQKEVLLREIHHRVKNSLAIVSGLIELQEGSTESREAQEVLKDSQARIKSVALIHEKLYKTDSLSEIQLNTYIKDLVRTIHKTFTDYREVVVLSFDLDEVLLETDRVIPCGLLINELVVNAYKHAFSKNRPGMLEITLKRKEDELILTVSDNGPGLPDEFIPGKDDSIGSLLIQSFSSQLGATINLGNKKEEGAEFTFRFPAVKKAG